MEIDYLKNKEFQEIHNIEELKTSRGIVEFSDLSINNIDLSSRIATPDLRYFWDGDKFGIHVSDCEFSGQELVSIFQEIGETILNQMQILSWTRTKLDGVYFADREFSNLTFINFSNNSKLKTFGLKIPKTLLDFQINNCSKLENLEIFGYGLKLKKIDFSFCSISNFPQLELIDLEYLNIQNNTINKLDLSLSTNLMFLFGNANPLIEIKWPENLKKISVIELDEKYVGDDSLKVIYKYTDEKLNLELNAYNKQLLNKGRNDSIMKVKLIFIGNTTAGKSTLRRIFLSENGKEKFAAIEPEDSTHGVNVFSEKLTYGKQIIWVQGFDFGGQDYYHSTHLPFMGHKTLNILVYGKTTNASKFSIDDAYKFSMEVVENKEEVIFPINYWIGSLKKNVIKSVKNENEIGEFLNSRIHEGIEYNFEGFKIEKKATGHNIFLQETKLELIQNIKDEARPLEINNLEIKNTSGVSVGDIVSYNFHKKPKEVKEWLHNRISDYATTNPFLYTDQELIEWLQKQDVVVFELKNLFEKLPLEIKYSDILDLTSAIRRIHSHHFGYFFELKSEIDKSFFINKLDVFSGWIHGEILTKKLIENKNGYFELDDLKLSSESEPHKYKLIRFLEENNVIFKIKNLSVQKWVAPAYLPNSETIADKILLESFALPDCIFEFHGYFHNNIVLQIFDKFEENLILDPIQKEYIIWKNKVLLHQNSGKDKKAYLLIELKFPGEVDYEGLYPHLSISRNISGFISNSIFEKVFSFVKNKVEIFNPVISVKTKFNNYIPYESLFQQNIEDGKVRSNLIFHNQTLYSVFDFSHFSRNLSIIPTKIFIAYSKFDVEYVNELLLHLGPYQNQGEVVVFYDKDLKMGENWDEELKHQLTTSHILVCLVSPNMLNTKYVIDLEIPLAHENDIEIVPIILRECNWNYLKLNNGKNLLNENNAYSKATPLPSDKYSREAEWKIIAENLKNNSIRERITEDLPF